MMASNRSKRVAGESIIADSRGLGDYTASVFSYARLLCMASAESEEGFRVTDRRRRAEDEALPTQLHIEPPPKAEPRADPARPKGPARVSEPARPQDPERNL